MESGSNLWRKNVAIVYVVESYMDSEQVGNIYIACLMNLAHGWVEKKFYQIMYVNIGEIQNKRICDK